MYLCHEIVNLNSYLQKLCTAQRICLKCTCLNLSLFNIFARITHLWKQQRDWTFTYKMVRAISTVKLSDDSYLFSTYFCPSSQGYLSTLFFNSTCHCFFSSFYLILVDFFNSINLHVNCKVFTFKVYLYFSPFPHINSPSQTSGWIPNDKIFCDHSVRKTKKKRLIS